MLPTRSPIALTVLIASISTPSFAQNHLSLSEYLEQVRQKNRSIIAAQSNAANASGLAEESQLAFAPTMFANAQHLVDEKPTAMPAAQGDKTKADSYSIGISKQTTYGLNAKLAYTVTGAEVTGSHKDFKPVGKVYSSSPSLELSQSLWRNAFGSESRKISELSSAQSTAVQESENYKATMLIAQAEMTYWRLAAAREVRNAQIENLKRAQRILTWNTERVNLSLADKADLLQAQAAVRYRELEVSQAESELRSAAMAFNELRELDAQEVSEILSPISDPKLTELSLPHRPGKRGDIKAAMASAQLAAVQAELTSEKYKPNLELFAQYALHGQNGKYSRSASESISNDHPQTAIGLRLSAVVDRGLTSRLSSAATVQAKSARLNADYLEFSSDREWDDLLQRFNVAKNNLKLARDIEKIQQEKLNWERNRQQLGRSTTFQVLQFESDYTNAQLSRIQAEAGILQLLAQIKTFGVSL